MLLCCDRRRRDPLSCVANRVSIARVSCGPFRSVFGVFSWCMLLYEVWASLVSCCKAGGRVTFPLCGNWNLPRSSDISRMIGQYLPVFLAI